MQQKIIKDNSLNDEKYILPLDCLINLPFIATYDCEDLMTKYPGWYCDRKFNINSTYLH